METLEFPTIAMLVIVVAVSLIGANMIITYTKEEPYEPQEFSEDDPESSAGRPELSNPMRPDLDRNSIEQSDG